MNATILLDEQHSNDGTRLVRAMLRLTGDAPPRDDARPPLNLALVLDRSGSMAGEKLEAARRAAIDLVRRLSPRDVVGVVAYDDQVTVVAEPGTGAEQDSLTARIGAITSGGMTNLSGGWLRGRQLVEGVKLARDGETSIDRIILLTDGLANQGITDPDELKGLTGRAAHESGFTTTTIGFGTGFDEDLLRGMADAGGGGTYYIERADQAGDVFADELEGLLSLSAQNVTVELRPADAAEFVAVRHAYPRQQIDGGVRFEIGDLYAREPRRLLAEFVVRPDLFGAVESRIAELVVRADVVTADGGMEHRELRLPIVVSADGELRVDPEVRREALLLEAAEARRQARQDERRGDYDAGASKLREIARRIRAAAPADDEELGEEAQDLDAMADTFERGTVMEEDRKYMAMRMYMSESSHKRDLKAKLSRVRRRPRES